VSEEVEEFLNAVADYAQDLADSMGLYITIDTLDQLLEEYISLCINVKTEEEE